MPYWYRNDRSKSVVIMIAVIVIAIAVLGVLGFRRYLQDERQEESIRKADKEYNVFMLEAHRKKADLEAKLAALIEQGNVQIENGDTLVFLCTETAEASSEDLTEPATETESETERETEPATEKVTTEEETEPATTEAIKETETTKVTETKVAKKTRKTPAAPPPPEIEETPGEVYVETTAAASIYSEKELESGTNWPNAFYDNEYTPGGPASAGK